MYGNDSKQNTTERIPTVNERRFRRERKLNETERNWKRFFTPTVCVNHDKLRQQKIPSLYPDNIFLADAASDIYVDNQSSHIAPISE